MFGVIACYMTGYEFLYLTLMALQDGRRVLTHQSAQYTKHSHKNDPE